MVVGTASRIKRCFAAGTMGPTLYIFMNGQLILTYSTKDRFVVKLLLWPNLAFMRRMFIVALVTRIIGTATIELNCNDICFPVVMAAARFIIDESSFNNWTSHFDTPFFRSLYYGNQAVKIRKGLSKTVGRP
ncbi:hypothetical protein N781_06885 [Pontibacillus halophilus JSM 076056 = DSM 19796]|uniref:Uncharacterized protein n=1 Tax=Pontibacillus halophilus JSM 076056 = DSM 19796 TaxID=1385510 RepID=A0A0A5GF27_9BACI|nr:hypothetical protein N781_06885 [Pontibacillus halophilus JSM 076056 = DSM 19796]